MEPLEQIKILVVDDIATNLDVLKAPLERAGYYFLAAPSGEVALKVARYSLPDLILLDVMMPDMDGYELCRQLKADPTLVEIPVIFLTGQGATEGVVEGFAAGGVDYIVKPFRDEEVLARVDTHVRLNRLTKDLRDKTMALEREIEERTQLAGRISTLAHMEAERWGIEGFVGQSQTVREILKNVARMQHSDAIRVLVTGESGTGKELIARAIHSGSSRAEAPFVAVNCASIPRELADSMFFGHRKGAFTGADRNHSGYFELANGGTLFLDEIGDMPLEVQAKILRVLEDGKVLPLGADRERAVDARVLAATNADLERAVEEGRFRRDLYFRLVQFAVQVPPLRARGEDIALLSEHFLHLFAGEMGVDSPGLSAEALAALEDYAFPGNVRELKNIIERAVIECDGGAIELSHLHFVNVAPFAFAPEPAGDIPDNLQEANVYLIQRALAKCAGSVSAAAKLLGVHRSRIYRALAQDDSS